MDELYWDIFCLENETWDDALFDQAQEFLRQCPCNRYDGSRPRCVRCRLVQSLLGRRQSGNDPPKHAKSALEIVSSRASRSPPHSSEHQTDVTEAVEEQESEGLSLEWDEEWEPGRFDFGESNPEELDDILDIEGHITLQERDMTCVETLDTVDAEPEQNSCPTFSSPALQLVWKGCVPHHKGGLQGPNTAVWGATRIVFEQSYRSGTAHAVGIWANCQNPCIWLKPLFWIRRQRQRCFGPAK